MSQSEDTSEDSYDEEDVELFDPTPEVSAAFNTAVEKMTAGPYHFTLMEHPFKADQTPEDMTVEYVLGLKHLLLPAHVGKLADNLSSKIEKLVANWPGGGTSCGNAVWRDFMMPKLEEAERMMGRKQWKKALGILLGQQLFASADGYWIHDQEVYCEFEEFSGWFSDYSKAWLQILGKSDAQLGLAVEGGREGGYRGIVTEMLKKWERETNEELREFDQFAVGRLARVRIFSDCGSSGEDDEEDSVTDDGTSGEDLEDESPSKRMKRESDA